MRLQLSSTTRTDFRKSETKKLRRDGGVPATVYGRGEESVSLAIQAEEFADLLKTPGGRLSLINLNVDGKGSKVHPVMIQEIQRDPITSKVLHVDFHRVRMDEPVHASVPVILLGEAPGTREGGILEQVTRELDVRALPDHIPTHIDVDVSHLEFGDNIIVRDVQVPEDVEVLGPLPDIVVASVRLPVVHIEEVVPEAEEELEEVAEEAAEGVAEEAGEEAGEES